MASHKSCPTGILGGTFDPIHYGHLRLGEELGDALGLEHVRLVPAKLPPHRAEPEVSAQHRLAMARLAAAGNPLFVVDDRELRREGPSYTADTLLELRNELGNQVPLCLMLGVDAFVALMTWSRWRQLFDLAHLVIATRPGYSLEVGQLPEPLGAITRERIATGFGTAPSGCVLIREIAALDISASSIRQALARRHSTRYLLPDSVLDYIRAHHLYRGTHGG
ncbi:MAG: nicotinate-nucleotide adenylyltransferase [Betaproteobacteria bacterium]|nr:nicotinate-nucleotide adenylyltransferase [Betaproteobacteria bacterium]